MRVKASQRGYYGAVIVEPGTEFEVPDGAKASWFVQVPIERKHEVSEADELDESGPKKKAR